MVVRKVVLLILASGLLAIAGAALAKSSAVAPCNASQLSGTFTHIPGSDGAGNTSYRLTLANRSSSTCFVTGIPRLVLLDKQGKPLPTSVRPATPGVATSAKITLAPGSAAIADARFSPDVPGSGEQHPGACEKTAYWLNVSPAPGTGSLRAPISPPTPVCEKGGMSFSLLKAAAGIPYVPCLKNAKTTVAMLACINTEYRRVSALLNRVYRKLLGTPGVDKQKLAAAESRWLAFRDADCKFAASINAGGSLESVDVGTCLIDDTTVRIKQLQLYQSAASPH
jgi:uncharacterized protein YecT (DUF1311 family)